MEFFNMKCSLQFSDVSDKEKQSGKTSQFITAEAMIGTFRERFTSHE